MKKVFAPLLIIFFPLISLLRKTKLDNFVGGLIFGAVFSLVVNLATVQVQEMIQKQRVLEAIENEILNNLIQSNNVLKFNKQYMDDEKSTNFLKSPTKYSRDLWEQSTEPLKYIVQLDRETQSKIAVYYSFIIPNSNALVDKADYLTRDKLSECYWKLERATAVDNNECRSSYVALLRIEQLPAEWISKGSFELLKVFHPTKDRLNNLFLKFIMGDQSIRPLSGE